MEGVPLSDCKVSILKMYSPSPPVFVFGNFFAVELCFRLTNTSGLYAMSYVVSGLHVLLIFYESAQLGNLVSMIC